MSRPRTALMDPAQKITVVALTNTTLEGLTGKFPAALTAAVHESRQ